MALEVGIVGLPGAGKTTLFNVLTCAGAHVHERKEHVGMAPIADERLDQVAGVVQARKVTPAAIRIAAGVTLRACTTPATWSSRSSAIGAIPTCSLRSWTCAPAHVSTLNSVVLPAPGRPTMPTSRAIRST